MRTVISKILIVVSVPILFVLWFYNHKVIDGDYTKLTIKMPNEDVTVIDEKEKIRNIINSINNSPRNLGTEKPWYNYELASLIFENDSGDSKAVHYMMENQNIKIRFGEINTDLVFEAGEFQESEYASAAVMENEDQEKVILEYGTVETYSINGQTFEIIPYYQPYLDFMDELEATKGNREDLFSTYVVKPFSKELYGHEYYGEEDPFYVAPVNTDKMIEMIIQLDDQYKEISRFIKEGLEDSTALLTGSEKVRIYLQPHSPDFNYLEMGGVVAFAADKDIMVLQIDPRKYTEKSIKQTIAHELHHVVTMEVSDWSYRKQHLLDRVIMEGKADTFGKLVYPDYDVAWIEPLSPEANNKVWSFIDENKGSYKMEDLTMLHLGRPSSGIPKWSNYRIGYRIMEDFLERNPEVTLEQWTEMRADEILELSGFGVGE
ncbi:hypothetical protein FZC76_12635 [Sutcliffiella horikoshii]|uniref:DUF2268 domain-containing protein n=1 Tax=Sutcliffiella horikoshii TaxID=79883 RepID=A0A5D4SZI4_9BACI|nr:DUF2268 domain-containing putative Zn-dependent protease [Sutcliffiella horikoshii]TYS67434.1 hypothetical protein FZC76_12635 [Sutcliffiella horikoshii]